VTEDQRPTVIDSLDFH